LERFVGKKVNELTASLRTEIDGASGKEMNGFSDALAKANLNILHKFGSDESLVQENIDFLSRIVASKKGREKGLEGILPGLMRK
jgi:hypothetical protein